MYVTPKKASQHFNVTDTCLRQWSKKNKIKYIRTQGGHRRYWIGEPTTPIEKTKIIYCRVSSSKQRADLDRQCEFLKSKYPHHTLNTAIGSGINFQRKGFKRILESLFLGTVQEVVVAKKDRFTRFGFDLFEWIFKHHKALLVSDSTDPDKSFDKELSDDLLAIITVFTARYYGRRKYRISV